MRKAIIATIVASALFAVGAFAAQFTVNAEDIASGADEVTACAEIVDINFDPTPNDSGEFEVATATVTFYQDDAAPAGEVDLDVETEEPITGCAGYDAQVNVVDGDGNNLSTIVEVGENGTAQVIFDEPSLAEDILYAAAVVDGQELAVDPTPEIAVP